VGKVTLAFLENFCRRSRVPEWRVFDVCAQMRAQSEKKKTTKLEILDWRDGEEKVAPRLRVGVERAARFWAGGGARRRRLTRVTRHMTIVERRVCIDMGGDFKKRFINTVARVSYDDD
jgi:hypothetical protein